MKRRLPLVHDPSARAITSRTLSEYHSTAHLDVRGGGISPLRGGRASTEPSSLFPQPVARLVLGRVLDHQDWRLVRFVVAEPTTRNVRRPSGIVSPGRQFGTALVSVGGSAGAPSAVSSLKRKAIWSLLSVAGRQCASLAVWPRSPVAYLASESSRGRRGRRPRLKTVSSEP
jgi:hypothetical protein